MTAPALVLLAHGSTSNQVAEVAHAMRVGLQTARPEVSIHTAFLDHCPPSGPQVIARIARSRTTEVVFVPMNLSSTFGTDPRIAAMVETVSNVHPKLRFAVSRPVGPEAPLLALVDRRLRSALSAAHAYELDGLVLSAEGTHDQRSQSLLSRRARQWSMHHKLPVVTATATGMAPGTAAAIASLRSQGRRHIAVGSLFLAPDEVWQHQAEQAYRAGAIAVSEPLGAEEELLDIAWGRYAVAAMGMIDFGITEAEATAVTTEENADRHLQVVGA
ncbi:MAG: CbiX/SirB N-terminal domain-containing protein [Propionibacteriaceae bacterium]|nr:CbiX/SirB N-terminal domain-containing protein [Propionibacteriaceae bacterium]